MKSVYLLVVSILSASGVAWATSGAGTLHDLSSTTWSDDVCIYCHVSMGVELGKGDPTWNPAASSPGRISDWCMSCHDGTVAVDKFHNPPTDPAGSFIAGRASSGTNLNNDHPLNFSYDGALAASNRKLARPFSSDWVDAAQTLPLFEGTLQCPTCHNPHNNSNPPFLNVSNGRSALCLTCHLK